MTSFIMWLIAAYLLGSVPIAYLIARLSRGIDLRQYGSGNVGASNLLKSTSRWLTLPVILFDCGKGALAVGAANLLGMDIAQQVALGLAAIIGHNWPVFLRFSGGRGNLTTLGVAIMLPSVNYLFPWSATAALTLTAIGAFIIHDTAVGAGTGIASLPLVSWAVGEPLPITLGFLVIFLIIFIRRLTARQTSVTVSVSRGQLFINRLIFDRDIRNREEWLRRKPLTGTPSGQPSGLRKHRG